MNNRYEGYCSPNPILRSPPPLVQGARSTMVQILPEDQCRARQRNNDRYILSLELTNINFVGCPARLSELEKHADMAAKYMALTSKKPNIQQDAMNRLRQLFNLEFKMLCDVCGPDHYQDEISAPER